jgi:hypothetical protein
LHHPFGCEKFFRDSSAVSGIERGASVDRIGEFGCFLDEEAGFSVGYQVSQCALRKRHHRSAARKSLSGYKRAGFGHKAGYDQATSR